MLARDQSSSRAVTHAGGPLLTIALRTVNTAFTFAMPAIARLGHGHTHQETLIAIGYQRLILASSPPRFPKRRLLF